MAWLDAHQPPDRGSVLIHNDFRLDNVVYDDTDPTRPIALLDWEMATIGDPLMDLGGAMAYWIETGDGADAELARMQPSNVPGMLTRREIVDYYAERTGITVTDAEWTFYLVFGRFRLAAIAQQIYYRFHTGQTTNPRFAMFGFLVAMLDERCRTLIAEAAGASA